MQVIDNVASQISPIDSQENDSTALTKQYAAMSQVSQVTLPAQRSISLIQQKMVW